MIELTLILPTLLLMGLGCVQYGLLFFTKNNINYAGFEAARAGSMGNANIDTVIAAYKKALIPMYGGGRNAEELAQSYEKVKRDTGPEHLRIELLNPTVESFADWNSSALQQDTRVGNGARVIPVLMQNFPEALHRYQVARDAHDIGPASGQSLSDASLIKIKITHGYKPQVPLLATMLTKIGAQFDDGKDPFVAGLYRDGRIPVVSHVTMQMQSNAIESVNASFPGAGNGGRPINPLGGGDEPDARCLSANCTGLDAKPPPQSPDINPGTGRPACDVA